MQRSQTTSCICSSAFVSLYRQRFYEILITGKKSFLEDKLLQSDSFQHGSSYSFPESCELFEAAYIQCGGLMLRGVCLVAARPHRGTFLVPNQGLVCVWGLSQVQVKGVMMSIRGIFGNLISAAAQPLKMSVGASTSVLGRNPETTHLAVKTPC
eukprot:2564689-Amphidinium_carterae.1